MSEFGLVGGIGIMGYISPMAFKKKEPAEDRKLVA